MYIEIDPNNFTWGDKVSSVGYAKDDAEIKVMIVINMIKRFIVIPWFVYEATKKNFVSEEDTLFYLIEVATSLAFRDMFNNLASWNFEAEKQTADWKSLLDNTEEKIKELDELF